MPVREMEATEQLIEARNRKDAAAIAKAEAALAGIAKDGAATDALSDHPTAARRG